MEPQDSYRWFWLMLMIMMRRYQLLDCILLCLLLNLPHPALHNICSYIAFSSYITCLSSPSKSLFFPFPPSFVAVLLLNNSPPCGAVVDRIKNMFQ